MLITYICLPSAFHCKIPVLQNTCPSSKSSTCSGNFNNYRMISLFSTLLDSLILNLLSEWVYAADVGRLDSALCKELERENFLRSPHCVLQPPAGVTSQGQFTNWLFKRQFSTSALDVSALLKQNCLVRSRYVKQQGHHVRTVNISSASTSTDAHDAALQFICKFCPNVRVFNCQAMVGAIGMGHVVKWRKTLTHLTVTMVEAQEDFSVLGAECQSLSELTICSNGQVCASSWSRFFEVCAPTLRKVSSTLPLDDLTCGIIAARCPL
jgi:hypothetical protein